MKTRPARHWGPPVVGIAQFQLDVRIPGSSMSMEDLKSARTTAGIKLMFRLLIITD